MTFLFLIIRDLMFGSNGIHLQGEEVDSMAFPGDAKHMETVNEIREGKTLILQLNNEEFHSER